jgi:hypothetical protein
MVSSCEDPKSLTNKNTPPGKTYMSKERYGSQAKSSIEDESTTIKRVALHFVCNSADLIHRFRFILEVAYAQQTN